ncbi:hypothetical protein CDD83_4358 [Cordyceps sp. RAO-2017]|nr:hypothetical protein CDD83_4358 [Cordyceps sp. RAO-2017]
MQLHGAAATTSRARAAALEWGRDERDLAFPKTFAACRANGRLGRPASPEPSVWLGWGQVSARAQVKPHAKLGSHAPSASRPASEHDASIPPFHLHDPMRPAGKTRAPGLV